MGRGKRNSSLPMLNSYFGTVGRVPCTGVPLVNELQAKLESKDKTSESNLIIQSQKKGLYSVEICVTWIVFIRNYPQRVIPYW